MHIHNDAIPLWVDENGDVRIGQTRVLLDLVIHAFLDGESPESIVQNLDPLSLADVYSIIGYYLRHRGEVDAFLADRDRRAEQVRKAIEARQPDMADFRERLLARQAQMKAGHAQ